MRFRFAIIGIMIFTAAAAGQEALSFDVATVKLAPALVDQATRTVNKHVGTRIDGGLADFGAMSLSDLLQYAFRVPRFRIPGVPVADDPRFDVQAKLPVGSTPDQVPEMLQQLLMERFGLAFHWDSRELPVYALVVDTKAARLPVRAPDSDPAANRKIAAGAQLVPLTMDRFAGALRLDRPTVDRTELQGEFMLPTARLRRIMVSQDRRRGAESSGSGPEGDSIIALLKDIGLKVKPRKLPFPALIVDKIAKAPTEQ